MNIPATFRIAALFLLMILPPAVVADEWGDAGFTALHRVVWLDAGYTLREARRWKSRCGITDPAQVAAWESIGLNTPTAVSLWINKGYTTPESVVKIRNGKPLESPTPQTATSERTPTSRAASERKKREWLKKSHIAELVAAGVGAERAEEWIYAGYSSDEVEAWLKVEGIRLPDDLMAWFDIGVDTPEVLLQWQEKGLTTPTVVQKQMIFKQSEREKFKRRGISPEQEAEWRKIGAKNFNQVNYLISRDYSVELLREWMAAGFIKLNEIELWRGVGLAPDVSRRWRDAGFNADEAALLLAEKFSPQEIVAWQDLFGPYTATQNSINSWRRAGFDPGTAAQWIERHPGVSAEAAELWRESGHHLESEWVLLESTPAVVGQWRSSDFSAAEARQWIKGGLTIAMAQQWHERGLNVQQAKEWQGAGYTPDAAELWLGQGVEHPARADRLKKITIDVSDYFIRGVTYNSFRKTAKLLGIHQLPSKLEPRIVAQLGDVSHFDTLTPFAKCMTAYANKTALSETAVNDIEHAHFYQTGMKETDAIKFMQHYRDPCEDWTLYIFGIWLRGRN